LLEYKILHTCFLLASTVIYHSLLQVLHTVKETEKENNFQVPSRGIIINHCYKNFYQENNILVATVSMNNAVQF